MAVADPAAPQLSHTSTMVTANHSATAGAVDTARLSGLDWAALVLMIVGGLNWGLVGVFSFDLVAAIFGPGSGASRVIYALVGLAALWGVWLAVKLSRRPG